MLWAAAPTTGFPWDKGLGWDGMNVENVKTVAITMQSMIQGDRLSRRRHDNQRNDTLHDHRKRNASRSLVADEQKQWNQFRSSSNFVAVEEYAQRKRKRKRKKEIVQRTKETKSYTLSTITYKPFKIPL
jgi:exonuclease I